MCAMLVAWFWSACAEGRDTSDREPPTLSVASEAKKEKTDAEKPRLVIDLGPDGVIRFERKTTNLWNLELRLAQHKHLDAVGRRARGLRPFRRVGGQNVSHLGILLRADKDAPWQHVRWVLSEVIDTRFYDVEFAVKRLPDRSYTKEEAAELGAEWKDVEPSARFDGRLPHPVDNYATIYPLGANPKIQSMAEIFVEIIPVKTRQVAWGSSRTLVEMPVKVRYAIEAFSDPDQMEAPQAKTAPDLGTLGLLARPPRARHS
jgi:hypothetical protein